MVHVAFWISLPLFTTLFYCIYIIPKSSLFFYNFFWRHLFCSPGTWHSLWGSFYFIFTVTHSFTPSGIYIQICLILSISLYAVREPFYKFSGFCCQKSHKSARIASLSKELQSGDKLPYGRVNVTEGSRHSTCWWVVNCHVSTELCSESSAGTAILPLWQHVHLLCHRRLWDVKDLTPLTNILRNIRLVAMSTAAPRSALTMKTQKDAKGMRLLRNDRSD